MLRAMRAVVLAALVAACRGGSSHTVETVSVNAYAGDTAPEAQADVVSHDANGEPVDGQSTDDSGHTEIAIVAGGTITVAFPGSPGPSTPAISLVTVQAPEAGGEVDIHGPPHPSSPAAAGVLLVQPPAFTADTFSIQLGCTATQVMSFPASIDVSSLCVTSDANVDVLVLARTGGQITGYVAGRVPLADGFAMFQPAAWQTTTPTVPIANTTAAQLSWSLRSDGMSFGGQVVTTSAPIYTGLKIDGALLVASIGTAQVTTREIAGTPTSVNVDSSDFLAPATVNIAFDGTRTYNWAQIDIGASVMDLHLEYGNIVWDVVLPPSASGITMPALGGDLSALVPEPTASSTTTLQYVQGSTDAGFYLESPAGSLSTVAELPADGEIRTSRVRAL
jgi:hypothetical protein